MEHEFDADQYGRCQTCQCMYHCSQCEEGCGGQGHLAGDAEGTFFTCQDRDRTARMITRVLGR